jgi:uncharacterized protein YdiU (UPF0061 family)
LENVLRVMQGALYDAQVNELMRVLQRPYEEQPGAEKYRVAAPKQVRMGVELLSCSS